MTFCTPKLVEHEILTPFFPIRGGLFSIEWVQAGGHARDWHIRKRIKNSIFDAFSPFFLLARHLHTAHEKNPSLGVCARVKSRSIVRLELPSANIIFPSRAFWHYFVSILERKRRGNLSQQLSSPPNYLHQNDRKRKKTFQSLPPQRDDLSHCCVFFWCRVFWNRSLKINYQPAEAKVKNRSRRTIV